MEDKTISYLNSKMWYRAIKVVYLILLASFLIGYPIGIFIAYGPEYDNNSSIIKCANGEEFVLNRISLSGNFLSDNDIKKAAESFCLDTPIKMTTAEYEAKYGQLPDYSGLSFSEKIKPRYELISNYTNRNWFASIGYSLLSILAVLLCFEIIRRIFYYVVLGVIRPQK
ncbi:MAG: hypothetical protein AAB593_02010 [Patescibacteria group bacterium]